MPPGHRCNRWEREGAVYSSKRWTWHESIVIFAKIYFTSPFWGSLETKSSAEFMVQFDSYKSICTKSLRLLEKCKGKMKPLEYKHTSTQVSHTCLVDPSLDPTSYHLPPRRQTRFRARRPRGRPESNLCPFQASLWLWQGPLRFRGGALDTT